MPNEIFCGEKLHELQKDLLLTLLLQPHKSFWKIFRENTCAIQPNVKSNSETALLKSISESSLHLSHKFSISSFHTHL